MCKDSIKLEITLLSIDNKITIFRSFLDIIKEQIESKKTENEHRDDDGNYFKYKIKKINSK